MTMMLELGFKIESRKKIKILFYSLWLIQNRLKTHLFTLWKPGLWFSSCFSLRNKIKKRKNLNRKPKFLNLILGK